MPEKNEINLPKNYEHNLVVLDPKKKKFHLIENFYGFCIVSNF
jgi:hypothetical protein